MSSLGNVEIDEVAFDHGMNPTADECFRHSPYLMVTTILTSLAGVLVGFDVAVLNGILIIPSFAIAMKAQNFSVGEWATMTSWMTSSLLLGAAMSSPLAAPLADAVGRKTCINISLSIIFVGGCIQTGANSQYAMIVGRVVVGIAIGLLSSVVPLYLAELSPKSMRGSIISLFQVMIAFGILLAFLVTLAFNDLQENHPYNWRFILGLQAAMPIVIFLLVLALPESPRWLIDAGKNENAKSVLMMTRWCQPVGKRLNSTGEWEIITNIDVEYHMMCLNDGATTNKRAKWFNFVPLLNPSILLRTSNGVIINILAQLTGFNSIILYSSTIFASLGISADKTTAVIGALNVASTFASMFLIDRFGRRVLLFCGSVSMCICLCSVAGIVLSTDPTSDPRAARAIAIFISLFIVSFAYSYGPISWLYPAEIFPKEVRPKGVSLSTSAGWLTNFAVNQSVPYMILPGSAVGGLGGTFLFFAVWTFVMSPWALAHVYETANLTLEDMDDVFKVQTFNEYFHYISANLSYSLYNGDKSMREFTSVTAPEIIVTNDASYSTHSVKSIA